MIAGTRTQSASFPSHSLVSFPDEPTASNQFLRLVHAALLLHFSLNDVRGFWDTVELTIDGMVVEGWKKLEYLWNSGGHVPLEFAVRVMNACETFLLGKGLDPETFVSETLLPVRNYSILSRKAVWDLIRSFSDFMLQGGDTQFPALSFLPGITGACFPGTHHRLLRTDEENGSRTACLLFILDPRFGHDFPKMNPHVWLKPVIRHVPRAMGFPAFDSVEILSDAREVHEIMGSMDGYQPRDIDDYAQSASYLPFSWVLEHYGIAGSRAVDLPESDVLWIHSDICGIDDATLFHGNCAYGAPGYLYRVCFTGVKRLERAAGNPFDVFARSKILLDDSRMGHSYPLHDALLRTYTGPYECRYHEKSETFSINGKRVASKIPARILARIIEDYVENGRTQFPVSRFATDPFIIEDFTRDHNLNIRLQRLAECIAKKVPDMSLTRKIGDGLVTFECRRRVVMRVASGE